MLSDGEDKNTAAWTNYSQPCVTANPTTMHPLLTCAESNPVSIELGSSMGTVNGVQDNLIDSKGDTSLMGCWRTALWDSDGDDVKDAPIDADGDGLPEQLWNITLPVVNCPYSKVGNCMEVCGAVNVNVVWILRDAQTNKIDEQAPYKMADWNMEGVTDGKARWNSFVDHFNLKMPNGEPAYYVDKNNPGGFMKKSIYFLPDCTPHELKGKTGGENFGILARIPVLVR
jgi:hypothetical protein